MCERRLKAARGLAALRAFGGELMEVVDELNEALSGKMGEGIGG